MYATRVFVVKYNLYVTPPHGVWYGNWKNVASSSSAGKSYPQMTSRSLQHRVSGQTTPTPSPPFRGCQAVRAWHPLPIFRTEQFRCCWYATFVRLFQPSVALVCSRLRELVMLIETYGLIWTMRGRQAPTATKPGCPGCPGKPPRPIPYCSGPALSPPRRLYHIPANLRSKRE